MQPIFQKCQPSGNISALKNCYLIHLSAVFHTFISGEVKNMPFILSVGTAFSDVGGGDLTNNCSSTNAEIEQSDNSSTIYNI